jgi:hypothetical protein
MDVSTNHKCRNAALGGYLLLEVVLALGVASLVVGAVFSLASGALSVSQTIAEEGRDQIAHETFLSFLGRNFEMLPGNAVLDLKSDEKGSHYLSDMTFQNVPTSFGWAGQTISAEAVQLSTVQRRDNTLDIVLRYYEEAILDDSDSTADVNAEPVAEIILLRNVWRFEWEVLDGRTMEWDYEWDTRGRMPLQLKLNVVFHRSGDIVEHYFWIPPKMNPETLMKSQRLPGASGGGGPKQPDGGDGTGTGPGGGTTTINPGGGRGGNPGGRGGNTGGRGGNTGGRGGNTGGRGGNTGGRGGAPIGGGGR